MRLPRALALLCAAPVALSATSCGSSKTAGGPPAPEGGPADTPVPRTDPAAVHVVGSAFRDGHGRQLLFRGYNAKATILFDVTFDDGRVPEETFDDFTETGAARFESMGWNVMRLPIDWSGLEPHPGNYSEAFLAKIGTILDLALKHHFYVIIDMHQDGYSKEIGEDGQPLWAIVPKPTMLLQGPFDDARRLSDQVIKAGYSFFNDANATDGRPLQAAYIDAVKQIVRRYVGHPAVLGYEAFNEPVLLYQTKLVAFHQAFADGVHAIDADAPILFEPISTRNQIDMSITASSPWSHGAGAYAVHIYTGWFSMPDKNSWASQDPTVLAPSMDHAEIERASWGTPMFVTEFGCDVTAPQGVPWIKAELDLQDKYLASSTVWEFSGRGSWGFHDAQGHERPATTKTVSRSYPRAVAGDLVKIERPKPGDMVVHYKPSDATRGVEHEVSLSDDYSTNAAILCDGHAVTFTKASGRATFVCPTTDTAEHTFEVVGTPAP